MANEVIIKEKKRYKKLDFKYERFTDIYIKNGFNGLRAYKSINPNITNESAKEQASKILSKKEVNDLIYQKLTNDNAVNELKELSKGIYADLKEKDITYKDKLQYIRTSLELKGKLNNQHKNTQVNVGIVVNKDNK